LGAKTYLRDAAATLYRHRKLSTYGRLRRAPSVVGDVTLFTVCSKQGPCSTGEFSQRDEQRLRAMIVTDDHGKTSVKGSAGLFVTNWTDQAGQAAVSFHSSDYDLPVGAAICDEQLAKIGSVVAGSNTLAVSLGPRASTAYTILPGKGSCTAL
jgi:hypothetical protein